MSGDDTTVAAGKRLRFRLYLEDPANVNLASGFTATVTYSGTSAGA